MGRRPKPGNEYTRLATAARLHLRRAEALGESLDERRKAKEAASPEWTPDEDWRRDFSAVTTVIQHAGNSLIRALEGNKGALAGMTEAQLEAQYRAELVRGAQTLSDEEWEQMVAARVKKAP